MVLIGYHNNNNWPVHQMDVDTACVKYRSTRTNLHESTTKLYSGNQCLGIATKCLYGFKKVDREWPSASGMFYQALASKGHVQRLQNSVDILGNTWQ